ncbi:MAG TPA: hypothetical protein VK772_06985 [Puia sp.]|nr:hypothetical protein [Puia sp.]
MATQAGYVGRIGNMIHYRVGDKYYSRLAPRKYKQTKATKAKSSEFGMASTIGRLIRQSLDTVIFNPSDNKMQTDLVREIFEWLQVARNQPASNVTQPHLEGFNFSTENPQMPSRWKAKLEVSSAVSGQLQITIPSFVPKTSFIAPARTTNIVCKIASVVIDIKNKVEIGGATNKISYAMDKNKVDSQVIVQNLPMPKGSLLVTGMCLEFSIPQRQTLLPTKDKLFQPSQIIYAVYN